MRYMKWKYFLWVLLAWFLVAPRASASVVISEVAWMGSSLSSTDEWIELYNPDATTVDLTGWRILSDDGSPSIVLSGSISANGYFLIERTDDNAAPGVTADLVAAFGNGLSNGGETLRLKNASDTDIDVVVGGTDWVLIGGDNTTKDTAQKTSNSWVTGAPTPRISNIAQGGEVQGVSTTNTSSTTSAVATTNTSANASSGGSAMSKQSMYPRKTIVVAAGEDMRALRGFPVSFTGSSTGLFNEPLDRATYRWNFGDGSISNGQLVTHRYDFAGEYIVTLEVFWGSHHERDRLAVVVSAPEVGIAEAEEGPSGFVRLENTSLREVDISGWILKSAAGSSFVFPQNSFILPKKSFILSNAVSGITEVNPTLVLSFPHGGIAASWGAPTPPAPTTPVHTSVYSKAPETHESSAAPLQQKKLPDINSGTNAAVNTVGSTSALAATVLWEKSPNASTSQYASLAQRWPFLLGIFALFALAGFVILWSRKAERTVEAEYAIIEDIIEGKERE